MTRILTITLNPALDIAASTEQVVAGPKLRCHSPTMDPGGGGVNVARTIHFLGGTATAFVANGGVTGDLLLDLLRAERVPIITFPAPGLTRQSFAVTETTTSSQYRFSLPGDPWTEELADTLLARLRGVFRKGDLVIASGSLPPGIPSDIFGRINALVLSAGGNLILDTSGPGLVDATRPGREEIYCLRLGDTEMTQLAGRPTTSLADAADFAGKLVADGVARYVILSRGSEGTIGASATGRFCCKAPTVPVVSAIGAGDSMVGAVALSLSGGSSFAEAVAHGTAAAASAVTTQGTRLCDAALTEKLRQQIAPVPL